MSVEDVTGELVAVGATTPLLTDDEMDRTWRIASGLAKSGMFKDARQAEQAWAKILLGRDLGLSPTQAMTGIHIVEGKPMVAAVTLAAFVKKAPGYDYKVQHLDNEKCSIEFFFDGEPIGVSTFTMEDAKRAKLVRDGSGWVKFPQNMLFARALSNGVKWYAPDATHGIPVYHDGELGREPVALTAPAEVDFGDDEELAERLRECFERLGYTPAKVRTIMRGYSTHETRQQLLEQLDRELEAVDEPIADATVVPE